MSLVKRVILEFNDGETFVFNSAIQAELFSRFYTSDSSLHGAENSVDESFEKMDYAFELMKFTEFTTSIGEAIDAVEEYFDKNQYNPNKSISHFVRGQFF